MARRHRVADEDYEPEPYYENEQTAELEQEQTEIARLLQRSRKHELEWWAVYKRHVPLIAELNDLDMAVAEAYFKEPHLQAKGVAKQIGISTRRAREIIESERVREYLERRHLEVRASSNIYREKVLLGLLNEADRTEGGSASARVKALELLGKELGMFVERSDVRKQVSGRITQEHVGRVGVSIYLPDNQRDPGLTEIGDPPAEDNG